MPFKFSRGPEIEKIRNDSSLPIAKALDLLERNGYEIKYGEMSVVVQQTDYARARLRMEALPVEERNHFRASVDRSLAKLMPVIKGGKASRKQCDHAYADLMFWQALKELGS